MNPIYKLYLELLSERGYLELEEFLDILRGQVDEFFNIVYQNILEGIYTKSEEMSLTDEDIERIAQMEYERIENLRKKFYTL